MPIITGNVTDFGFDAMGDRAVEIVLTPSGSTLNGGRWIPPEPIHVTPDGAGDFEVNLVATDFSRPLTWLIPSLRWLNSVGGYSMVEYPDWRLFVPRDGGTFVDLVDTQGSPANSLMLITGPDKPPALTPNQYWIDTSNGGSKLYRTERV